MNQYAPLPVVVCLFALAILLSISLMGAAKRVRAPKIYIYTYSLIQVFALVIFGYALIQYVNTLTLTNLAFTLVGAALLDQPTYCNAQFVSDEGMAPGSSGENFTISCRMVEKVEVDPVGLPEIEMEIIHNKALRRDLDAMLQKLKGLKPSRNRAIAITHLGMDLKEINEKNPGSMPDPYPNSKDTSNTIVDKTADNLKL